MMILCFDYYRQKYKIYIEDEELEALLLLFWSKS